MKETEVLSQWSAIDNKVIIINFVAPLYIQFSLNG